LTLQKIIKIQIIHENSIGSFKNQKNYTDPPENQENSIHSSENSNNSRKLYWPPEKS
jgi:hypothetical protein